MLVFNERTGEFDEVPDKPKPKDKKKRGGCGCFLAFVVLLTFAALMFVEMFG